MGLTDLYEPCMEEAGEQGLLEYYLQEFLPLMLQDDPPVTVGMYFRYFIGLNC